MSEILCDHGNRYGSCLKCFAEYLEIEESSEALDIETGKRVSNPSAEVEELLARLHAMPRGEYLCPTEGCYGDGRYAAPGRGHAEHCDYPRTGWLPDVQLAENSGEQETPSPSTTYGDMQA